MYKIVIYLLILIFIPYIVLTSLWYYYPTDFFGIKYEVVGEEKIENFKSPALFIFQHDGTPNFGDSMIMSNEIKKSSDNFTIITKIMIWNLLPRTPYDLIFTGNESVKKSIKILNSDNICIFLHLDTKNKGIYYILKESKVPIVFVRKKLCKTPYKDSILPFAKLYNSEYKISYEKVDDYPIENNTPEEFMEYIKFNLAKEPG